MRVNLSLEDVALLMAIVAQNLDPVNFLHPEAKALIYKCIAANSEEEFTLKVAK